LKRAGSRRSRLSCVSSSAKKRKEITLTARLFTVRAGSSPSQRGTWVADAGCSHPIQGSTNIRRVTCSFDYYYSSDTLQYLRNHQTGKLSFSNHRMTIPIRNFDCGAKQISNDFRKTLKSETYPKLHIGFKSLESPFNQNDCFID